MSTGTGFLDQAYFPNPSIESQLGITTAGLSTPQQEAVSAASGLAPGAFSVFDPSIASLMSMMQGNLGGVSNLAAGNMFPALSAEMQGQFPGTGLNNALYSLIGGTPGGQFANTLGQFNAGNFPGLSATTGDMMSGLENSLWTAAQPQLQQGAQAINSQATGYGQAAASSPAQAEVSNMYQNTMDQIMNQALTAGTQQYNTDLGLMSGAANTGFGASNAALADALGISSGAVNQGAGLNANAIMAALAAQQGATQTGLGLPSGALSGLLQTGGLEQTTAQNALSNLYSIYGQQAGLTGQDLQEMLGFAGGGVQLPQEPPTQYGPSGFSSLLSAAGTMLPMLGTGGLSGLGNLFSGLFGGGSGSGATPYSVGGYSAFQNPDNLTTGFGTGFPAEY